MKNIIAAVKPLTSGGALLQFVDESAAQVPQDWVNANQPEVGGAVDLHTERYTAPAKD